jgi:uncharacterized protein with WD repeat
MDMKFSPDGKYLAVCHENQIKIFESPDHLKSIEPLLLYKKCKILSS